MSYINKRTPIIARTDSHVHFLIGSHNIAAHARPSGTLSNMKEFQIGITTQPTTSVALHMYSRLASRLLMSELIDTLSMRLRHAVMSKLFWRAQQRQHHSTQSYRNKSLSSNVYGCSPPLPNGPWLHLVQVLIRRGQRQQMLCVHMHACSHQKIIQQPQNNEAGIDVRMSTTTHSSDAPELSITASQTREQIIHEFLQMLINFHGSRLMYGDV